MASQGYRDWLAAGKPYRLVRPARALVTNVGRYGITVYHYPDDSHLQATVPEDHTPYSATGWPGANARWNARGVDIMPRGSSAAAKRENADIARQLIRDRDAGHPGVAWIKYINWTDEVGVCRQERWTPARTTRASSDRGHVHVSGRSDIDADARADDYDPIARMRGTAPLTGDDGMSWNDAQKANATFNNDETAPLDTDGTIDGRGNIQRFPNKTYLAIKDLTERVDKLAAAIAALAAGDGDTPAAGITAAQARAIAREELAEAEIVPRPEA